MVKGGPAVVIILVASLAGACGHAGKAAVATTTTKPVTTTAASTTTTDAPVRGTDDNAVQLRLNNVATAEFTLYTVSQAFTADPATLSSVDPTITYGSGLDAPSDPHVVDVVVSADSRWACLTGKSDAGHVFVEVVGPAIDAYGGTTALRACNSGVVAGLHKVTG